MNALTTVLKDAGFNATEIDLLEPQLQEMYYEFLGTTLFARIPDEVGEEMAEKMTADFTVFDIMDFLKEKMPNFQEVIDKAHKEFFSHLAQK